DMYFNRNRAGCPQASYGHGACQATHTTAAGACGSSCLSRSGGKTVTATVPTGEQPVAFIIGQQVYKSGTADPNFPGGMKTIASVSKTQFTYAESGSNGNSRQPSTFDSGAYPIKYVSNNASKNVASSVSLNVQQNSLGGWSRGIFLAYSTDTQSPACSTCNRVTVRVQENIALDNQQQVLIRNDPAFGWTENPSAVKPREINISNSPTLSARFYPSLTHLQSQGRVQLSSGKATVGIPDKQNFCTCKANSANSCTTAVSDDGSPYPGIQGTLAITGTGADVVDYSCF